MTVVDGVAAVAGVEDIWYLKEIQWSHDPLVSQTNIKIITQNFNGTSLTHFNSHIYIYKQLLNHISCQGRVLSLLYVSFLSLRNESILNLRWH